MPSQSRPRGLSNVTNRLGTTSTTLGEVKTILNSWKGIAAYLGRGVRTVQRWERECGLPVHRPHNHSRSPVIAIPTEIDNWLRNGELKQARTKGNAAVRVKLKHLMTELQANIERMCRNVEQLRGCLDEQMQPRRGPAPTNGKRLTASLVVPPSDDGADRHAA